MNNETKLERHYNSAKMMRTILMMEQFHLLSTDSSIDEKERTCARKLFEHFRRLAICILTKEMPEKIDTELMIDVEFMKNMYRHYSS